MTNERRAALAALCLLMPVCDAGSDVFYAVCVCVCVFAAGVPGCPGSAHGAGRVQSQTGAVDQRLPGRSGETK